MLSKEEIDIKRKEGLAKLTNAIKLDPTEKPPPENVNFKEPCPGAIVLNLCDYVENDVKCENARNLGTRFCNDHKDKIKTKSYPKTEEEVKESSDDDNPNEYMVDSREGLFQIQATMYGAIDMWVDSMGVRSDVSMYESFYARRDEFLPIYQNLLDKYGYEGLMKYITNPVLAWTIASGSIGMEKYLNIQRLRKEEDL